MGYQLQEVNIKQVQRVVSNFKKDSESRHSFIYFQTRLERLTESWRKCEEQHFQTSQELAVKAEELRKYMDEYERLESLVIDYITLFRTKMAEYSAETSPASGTAEQLKLERIRIPTFNGTYTNWFAFRDLFKSMVHENASVSPVQKLQYLRNSLRDEAEQLINHLSMTAANYQPAWQLLCERYDNHRAISQEMMQRFFNLPKCNHDDSDGLKRIVDTVNQLMASVKTIETDPFDLLAIFMLDQKLDGESRKEWQKHIGNTKEIPNLSQFLEFIKQRFTMLEVLSFTQAKMQSKNHKHGVLKAHSAQVETKQQCPMCKATHKIYECNAFKQASVLVRRELVNSKKLCFNCLSMQHKVNKCPSQHSCKVCTKKHNTLLHIFTETPLNNLPIKVQTHCASTKTHQEYVLLATAWVKIQQPGSKPVTLRALLDTGAQRSFISESAMQVLRASRNHAKIKIGGVGDVHAVTTRGITTITALIKNEDGSAGELTFSPLILKSITSPLPSVHLPRKMPKGIDSGDLADPTFYQPSDIDILLGADVYSRILLPGFLAGNPCAQQTKLGWVLIGPIPHSAGLRVCHAFVSYQELDKTLQRFWEIEEVPSSRPLSEREKESEEHYKNHTYRNVTGVYSVRLPFTTADPCSEIGDTKRIAYIRFRQLEHRLSQDSNLRDQYRHFMEEYITKGHMTRIPDQYANKNSCYYLPHHAVIKASSSTTKLRVVFNASQKGSNGKSLNDLLLVGPTIQETILQILMRWRQHRFVVAADIEKMYRQILVHESDRNYQRILWRSNPTESIHHYQLNTVTYGTASAPFLAIRTLHQLASDEQQNFPEAAQTLRTDFYVDDLLTGSDCLKELLKRQADLRQLLEKGGLHLRKWTANNSQLLEHIPVEDRETHVPFNIALTDDIKTLGLRWHPVTDEFSFMVYEAEANNKNTKRSILAEVSKLFDPIGWLQPCIIIGKVTIQKLWLAKSGWDDPLERETIKEWLTVRDQLSKLCNLRIPRWIGFSSESQIELHGFCDASSMAYAAAVYIKVITPSSITINLLAAKSKVAPVKTQSIPRLELCGAVLLVKLMTQVIKAHHWTYVQRFHWTDSTIVLAWIQSSPSRWKVYVANRVSTIQQESTPESWHHVSSENNPADLATRGMYPTELEKADLWWHGPEWLKARNIQWKNKVEISHNGMEERIIAHVAMSSPEPEIFKRYSSFSCLTSQELKAAHNKCILIAQQHSFGEEIQQLREAKSVTSNIRLLLPWIDTEGILRVNGRIQNALVGKEAKYPALLRKGTLAKLLVKQAHHQTLHGGVQLTIATLRLQYWILSGQSMVRKIIHECLKCYKMIARPREQLMGILPPARVQLEKAFMNTGIDYAGPIVVKWNGGRGAKTTKAYIALFVCMATKAFHLELASDLSSTTCIAAIRRFIARRGKCRTIYSDCGSNFLGANKQLQEQYKKVLQTSGAELANEGIEWKFIPPGSPHFGGLWEAGVKSMKRHLYKTIGHQLLNMEEFSTLLAQIEACLNSRPLTQISDDPTDMAVLTPGHFLTGDNLFELKSDPSEAAATLLKNWKLVQQMKHSFWRRWSQEYLHRLQQRPKWLKQQNNPEVGELVLVKNDHIPSMQWPLARIIGTHSGPDGLVRVVTLKMNGRFTKRPITKICMLPFSVKTQETITPEKLAARESESSVTSGKRPQSKSNSEDNKRRKRMSASTPRCSLGTVLFTTLIVLGSIISPLAATANITQLNGGIYIEHLGSANLLRGSLQIKIQIPFGDLSKDEKHIQAVNESIRSMCSLGKSITNEIQCWDLVNHLSELSQEAIQKINTLRFIRSRVKRGILGRMLTAVFGVNEEVITDIKDLGENQEKLKQLIHQQGKIVLQATKTLNTTSSRVNKQLERFQQQLQNGISQINEFKKWYTMAVDHNKVNIQFLATYQRALNFVQEVHSKYNSILTAIYTQKGIWDCIKLAEFEPTIRKTQELLTAHLEILHVTTTKLSLENTDNTIEISGFLPIIDSRNYELVKATAIPQQQDATTFAALSVNSDILGINYNEQLYFETSEATVLAAPEINTNKFLLSLPTLIDMKTRPNCVIKEMYAAYAMSNCSSHKFHIQTLLWKQMINANSWLFVTPKPVPAQTVCLGTRSDIMLQGTGILRLSKDCTLYTKDFILTAQQNYKGSEFPVYITPKVTSFDNTSMSAQELKLLNITSVIKTTDSFASLVTAPCDIM